MLALRHTVTNRLKQLFEESFGNERQKHHSEKLRVSQYIASFPIGNAASDQQKP